MDGSRPTAGSPDVTIKSYTSCSFAGIKHVVLLFKVPLQYFFFWMSHFSVSDAPKADATHAHFSNWTVFVCDELQANPSAGGGVC